MVNRNVNRRVRSVSKVRSVRSVRPVRDVAVSNDSHVVAAIVRVVARRANRQWTGSMTELSAAIARASVRASNVLPENPRGLRSVVDRVIPTLRRLGIKASFGRTTDHSRKRFVSFVR